MPSRKSSVLTEVTAGPRQTPPGSSSSPADLSDPRQGQGIQRCARPPDPGDHPIAAVQEAYPDLKSNQNFLALQDQLEGTENRINASRRDYNEAVQAYNTLIRTFPDAIGAKVFYGAKPKVPFEAAAAAQKAPSVNFNAS